MKSDPVNLKFSQKYIDEIKLCLACRLHDCSISYCPHLIPDEAKARTKYREKTLKQKMNKGDKA